MIIDYLTELGMGILKIFLHPMLYLFLLVLYFGVVKRLKRERRQFHTRVFGGVAEIFQVLLVGTLIGIVFSIITVALGIQLSMGVVALLAATYLCFALPFKFRWLHPVYVFTVTAIVVKFLPVIETSFDLVNSWLTDIREASMPTLALLLGLLLLQEAILLKAYGAKMTSPVLLKSKRGQVVGGHEAKKLWILPILLFVPGGGISVISGWPFLLDGAESYSLILVPFAVGFGQLVAHSLPGVVVRRIGNRTLVLSVLILVGAGLSVWYQIPLLGMGMIVFALVVREVVLMIENGKNHSLSPFFTGSTNGATVLGVLPDSPAEKMGIKIGEVVTKVNGKLISKPKDVYYAVQVNAAFCKLEVIDLNGEPRIVQRSLYENEHHELGLLFVESDKKLDEVAG